MTTIDETKPETKTFAAETARVLHLMIHALYTNRDIFLRELISNASDACDKLRYAALTNDALMAGEAELKITLAFDKKAKTITITDTGIGMNHDDLIANLGTIAKSGTGEFLGQLTGDNAKDVNLIGQFGVGFYSSFMVADRVVVVSRKAGEEQAWQWESDGQGSYTVKAVTPAEAGVSGNKESAADAALDPGLRRDDMLPRGTSITLHLKKDASDYLDFYKLQHIVGTYSDHISFPIHMADEEGNLRTLNDGSAIWTRPKSEVTEEQYEAFYHDIAHSPEKPWAVFHNKAEGKTEYTSLLFVPGIKPFDLFHPERRGRVKLYVKRVFITDEGVELVPPYLRFLRGVVDSADLPLNISRETLQKSPVLDKIRESVTGKVLSELKKRAEKDPADYAKFWENFGSALKEGLCEANAPREKILEACRFYSTVTPAEAGVSGNKEGAADAATDPGLRRDDMLTSLADYKSRMKEGQEAIYYLTGDSLEVLRRSPQLEGFTKRGIEVLLLTDHVDDFWPTVTMKYGETPFRAVTKAGDDLAKFPLSGEEAKAEEQAETSDATKKLCEAMQKLYGDAVSEVRTTRKLADTPICLGVAEGAMDMRMERFLMEHKQLPKRAAKRVEINPTHPVIQSLAEKISANHESRNTKHEIEDALWLLYDQALIAEGEPVTDPAAFAKRLSGFLTKGLAA